MKTQQMTTKAFILKKRRRTIYTNVQGQNKNNCLSVSKYFTEMQKQDLSNRILCMANRSFSITMTEN